MNRAFLSIGSNIGNRLAHLTEAVRHLHEHPEITVQAVSSIYETEPVGLTEQAKFLNIAVEIKTALDPHQLLRTCQAIENKLGRTRKIRWGPRTADLDILLFNEEIVQEEELIIPHLRMHERAFVLIPLAEINPEAKHPAEKTLYKEQPAINESGVELWKQAVSVEDFIADN